MIRNRSSKDRLNAIRRLDAFPKVKEEYQTSSEIGGTRKQAIRPPQPFELHSKSLRFFSVSVLSRLLIIVLIYRETMYYLDSKLVFKFRPDVDMDTKLKIHIDVTVATPCRGVGADILDSTNQNVFSFGVLEEQDTWWELCPNQRTYFEYMQQMNAYLREEYHSLSVDCLLRHLVTLS